MLIFTKGTKLHMKHKFSLHDETNGTKHSIFGHTFITFYSFISVTLELTYTYSHTHKTHMAGSHKRRALRKAEHKCTV